MILKNRRPEIIENDCVFDELDADMSADNIIKAMKVLNMLKRKKSNGTDCIVKEFLLSTGTTTCQSYLCIAHKWIFSIVVVG